MQRQWKTKREKQEREHFFELCFPEQTSKLLRLPKDWDMQLHFLSGGYSTLW